MNRYIIKVVDNHIIVEIENNIVLVDTGAPYSVGKGSEIDILEKPYNLSSDYLGITVDKISEYIGTNIDILLGADILSDIYFQINLQDKLLCMDRTPIDIDGATMSVSLFMNIPIIEFEIRGKDIRAFLDTGAKLSYLDSEVTEDYESIGTETDFYPGVGQFSTPTYEVPITLLNQNYLVVFGNLPALLQMTLMMANTSAILGNELFKYFTVSFALQDGAITLRKIS